MNSQTLKENGFAEFLPLKKLSILNLPNNTSHVFVLVDKTLTEKAASDILYIGQAKKPVKKIFGGYIGSFGGKNVKRIHDELFNGGYIEKASISWMPSDDPKKAQIELLKKFKNEHGDYPTWNTPKKKTEKLKAKPTKVKPPKTQKTKPKEPSKSQ